MSAFVHWFAALMLYLIGAAAPVASVVSPPAPPAPPVAAQSEPVVAAAPALPSVVPSETTPFGLSTTPTLPVVDGFRVIYTVDGCIDWPGTPYPSAQAPDRYCHAGWYTDSMHVGWVYAYYVPALRAIVVRPWVDAGGLAHETCHAHQHLTVLQELGREPSIDLSEWLLTSEARASGLGLEAWAEKCAR